MSNRIINVRENVYDMETSPEFNTYSKVEIEIARDADNGNQRRIISVGDDSGQVLHVSMPQCSNTDQARASAQRMLARLQANSFQYKPYTATDTVLDPTAELGDAINVNGVYSTICATETDFGSLMLTKVSAPQSEEIEHEYYVNYSTNKELTREIGRAYSTMKITADDISAEVGKKVDGESSTGTGSESFGWKLTATDWKLQSGGTDVFVADKNGVSVTGNIAATSGTIGGFTIASDNIHSGSATSFSGTGDGVFISSSGIRLGKNFKVSSDGSLTMSGTLTVGGSTITAANLRSGATYGNNYNKNITTKDLPDSDVAKYFHVKSLYVDGTADCEDVVAGTIEGSTVKAENDFYCFGRSCSFKSVTVNGTTYHLLGY